MVSDGWLAKSEPHEAETCIHGVSMLDDCRACAHEIVTIESDITKFADVIEAWTGTQQ